MLNKFFQNFRLNANIVRLKIQGPLNSKSQIQITQHINRVQEVRLDALLVVINSFGGSLHAAKNISARLRKLSLNKQIPVYCFAEQFCLNSANLILTTGTRCFAHKFSVIGDFGFVYQGIDTEEFQKYYKVRQNNISTMKIQYKTNILKDSIIPSSKQLIKKVLVDSEQNLRQQILKNRLSSLNKIQEREFMNKLDSENGFCEVKKGLELGLIDGITGIEEFIIQKYPKRRIMQGADGQFEHPTIEWIRALKQSLRYHEK